LIGHLADETARRLKNDRDELWIKLGKNLQDFKNELEHENDKKRRNELEKEESEEQLVKRLKLMTEIAEKTDQENQMLLKLNDKLKIEFKS
jgi:hypothetical protein